RNSPSNPAMNLSNLFKLDDDLRNLAPGEKLLETGSANEAMYVLIEGALDIQVEGSTVETLQPGGIVGEMSLIEDLPVSADVVAAAESKVAQVDQKRFQFLVQNHPFFAQEVMKIMARRLRASNER
ncbi:MAG: cyclic nucleotide-binding domain-containing protein, partial [Verrucomicrobiota bacterium]